MKQEMIFTAKTVELALADAAEKLGVDAGALDYEVLEKEKSGFFGIGATPAKVKVNVDVPDEKPTASAVETKPETITAVKPEPIVEVAEPAPAAKPAEPARTEPDKAQRPRSDRSRRSRKPKSASNPTPAVQLVDDESLPPLKGNGDKLAREFVEMIVADLGLDAKVDMIRTRKSDRMITVTGDAAGVLIGHHGDTLDALQYLTNLAANKREEDSSRDYVHITVDVENYRAKREAALRSLANRMANKVKKTEKPVMLEPMSPYERRIIHSEIQNVEGVSTNSVGTDSNRRVVIFLESAGFSLPAGVRADKLDRPSGDRDRRRSRSGDRRDRRGSSSRNSHPAAPKPKQPLYNDGERMSAEEVSELVATYGAKETKEDKPNQPAKFKSFEDYMNSILGE